MTLYQSSLASSLSMPPDTCRLREGPTADRTARPLAAHRRRHRPSLHTGRVPARRGKWWCDRVSRWCWSCLLSSRVFVCLFCYCIQSLLEGERIESIFEGSSYNYVLYRLSETQDAAKKRLFGDHNPSRVAIVRCLMNLRKAVRCVSRCVRRYIHSRSLSS